MATSKKFSELPAASSVGNGDLFAIAHEDAQAETGYVSQKLTAAQAGQKMNGDTEYPTSLPSFPENGQNPFAALEKLNSDIIGLLPVSTASGSIATFSTSLALPLVECKAQIVAQQAGSGTPSPSNPRAISGYDEVVLTHAYNAQSETKTIALGQTVYGGVLDVVGGQVKELWSDKVDLSQLSFYKSSSGLFATNSLISQIKLGQFSAIASTWIKSSSFRTIDSNSITGPSGSNPSPDGVMALNSSGVIYFNYLAATDIDEFKAAMSDVDFIYLKATPTTITTTPTEVTTIADQEQNIFADCGDVEVSFKQGIQEYIDAKIAETQALIL